MSYLVLARKWRPQVFEDVVGQGHVTETLRRAISAGRIAHAYLFAGPRGVGKTTTARILAKALNCQSHEKPTPTPCNKCTSCVEITEGRSPDVLEIDGASHRGIDDARELQTHIQYATAGRYKVVIIDEVHMLTREAFNSLLKTLEEPPANVVFIFATTEPNAVPLTILSRCQRFDFRLISPGLISQRVKAIAEAEGFSISPEAADFIAVHAEGSMRDALSMLDQVLAVEPEGEISVDVVARLLGVVPAQAFMAISRAIGSGEPKTVLLELEKLLEAGIDPLQVAKGLIEHFRNALLAKSGALPEDFPNREIYAQAAQERSLEDLLRITKLLTDAHARMRRSETPRYLLEETLIYLSLLRSAVDIASIVEGVVEAGAGELFPTHGAKGSAAPRAEHHIEVPQPVPQSLPKDPRERFLALLGSRRKAMAAVLKDTKITYDDGRVIIHFPEALETVREELLVNSESFGLLEDVARKAFGKGAKVELVRDRPKRAETDNSAKSKIDDILSLFDAKLEG